MTIVKLTRKKHLNLAIFFPIDKFEKILYTIYINKTSCETSTRSEIRKKRGCLNAKRKNNR